MIWPSKPPLTRILMGLALACSPLMAAHAWVDVATISSTVGNTNGRLCTGLGRADIGCPAYAPYLSSAGNVGIGTDTPEAPLHVMQEIRLDRLGTSPGINMRRASGTTGSLAVNANNSALGVIGAKGYAPSGYPSLNNATIAFVAEETFTDTAQGTGIRLETTRLGANSRTERMRISADGNIGIGTTSPAARLDVSGTISATIVKLANDPSVACTAATTGAIKYQSGDFFFCRNGTAWEPLASIADSAAPDRIISGTTTMAAVSNTGFISITQAGTNTGWFDPQRGLVTLGVSATGSISGTTGYFSDLAIKLMPEPFNLTMRLKVGGSAGADRFRVWSNYGGTASSPAFGWNTSNGNGMFFPVSNSLAFGVSSTEAMRIDSNGNIGIGTANPTMPLEVSGAMKIAGTGSEVCGPGTYGTMRRNPTTGHLQICTEAQ